jgi:mannose-1-phosphate guanylyltransferase
MSNDTQVVLLAGGMGKRLGKDVPKCLLEVINDGSSKLTLLDICMDKLIKNGFKEFILLLGYKAEEVIKHVEGKYNNNKNKNKSSAADDNNITVKYSIDPSNRLGWGKAKAFKYALMNNKIDYGKRSLVTFPDDIILDDNIYLQFINAHVKNVLAKGSYATIALVNCIEYPYGVAEVDKDGNITLLKEKPLLNIPTSIGLYAFEPKVYEMIDELIEVEGKERQELESIILPKLAEIGRLASFFVDYSKWLPINTIKDYEIALSIFANKL